MGLWRFRTAYQPTAGSITHCQPVVSVARLSKDHVLRRAQSHFTRLSTNDLGGALHACGHWKLASRQTTPQLDRFLAP